VTDILKDMSSKLANLVKFIIRIHVSTFWLNENISCFRKVSSLWLLYLTQIQLSSNKGVYHNSKLSIERRYIDNW